MNDIMNEIELAWWKMVAEAEPMTHGDLSNAEDERWDLKK